MFTHPHSPAKESIEATQVKTPVWVGHGCVDMIFETEVHIVALIQSTIFFFQWSKQGTLHCHCEKPRLLVAV